MASVGVQAQKQAWEGAWFIRFCNAGPSWLKEFIIRCLALLFLNRFVMW